MSSQNTRPGGPDRSVQGDIAIIGMACMFPGAPDLNTYWQNILARVDAITDPPPEAWDADVFYDPSSTANDRVYCKRGGFIGPLATFDPLENGVMPLAVQGGEPDQWLALKIARAALADAGYADDVPERHRTAVILGKGTYLNRGNATVLQHGKIIDQTLQILKTLHPEYTEADLQVIKQQLKGELPPFNADTAPGLVPNIIAGRIANRLDLMGPSYTVDAACASSLIAADMAVRDLQNGRCDLALVGGAHVATPVPVLMLFCQLGALSHREQIRPFDKDADGTILGEGIGMVVLKRRADAERDGNRIYAVIKGIGTSSDGRGMSVMAPRLEGEILALQRAYEAAGTTPRTIGLIEAHGTGTPVGDATEAEALTQVFGPREGTYPWCAIGSVKSMVGHLMPAAGIAGLIKTALALYHKVLPPTLNVDEPHPKLALGQTPFYVNTKPRPWIHGARDAPRRAGVNAFGFGGVNVHVILEEYPAPSDAAFHTHHLHWDSEVCIVSAGSRMELREQIETARRFAQTGGLVHLKDLAYTLNVLGDRGSYRLAVVAADLEEFEQKLDRASQRLADPECRKIKDVQGIYYFEPAAEPPGKVAFLFPGEGSQYVNMLADLCIHFPEVREHFDLIDRVFARHSRDYLPSDVIFPRPAFSADERKAAEGHIWHMEGAVEAILLANQALFNLLSRLGIKPDAVVGHSTGEYSAMLAAGMIDLGDEERISQFSLEMNRIYKQAAVDGEISQAVLVAVGGDAETVAGVISAIDGEIYVAMDNCPHQAVIVGERRAVAEAVERLVGQGFICEQLPFDRPYHTPMFETYARRLQAFLEGWIASPPSLRIYSCTTMSPFPEGVAEARQVAYEHWLRPVAFRKTIEAMYADGFRIFVEVGTSGNLTAFTDDILRGRPHLAVPANLKSRSGINQLNHLVGMLAAQGVPMALDYLYASRSPRKLDLDRPGAVGSNGHGSAGSMKLATGFPAMGLSEETAARLHPKSQAQGGGVLPPATAVPAEPARAPKSGNHHLSHNGGSTTGTKAPQASTLAPESNVALTGPVRSGQLLSPPTPGRSQAPRPVATEVMANYFRTMDQFLFVQQEVMQAFLRGRAMGGASATSAPAPTASVDRPAASPGTVLQPGSVPGEMPAAIAPMAAPEAVEPALAAAPQPPAEADAAALSDAASAGPLSADAIRDTLLHLVSERTGYPVEMLDLNLDLEASLGIDSIKRVEILGAFQQHSGRLPAQDMEALASRKTLQEVIDFLVAASDRRGEGVQGGEPDAGPQSPPAAPAPDLSLAFIRRVVSLVPGQELTAYCELSLDEDPYLRDHTLGREISVTDPELRGLPIVPLTVSMEVLAEGASLVMPGLRLIGMRDIRAYRWIAVEGDRVTLEITARRVPGGSGKEVHVTLREAEAAEAPEAQVTPIVEGIMIFDQAFLAAPAAAEFALRGERPSRWQPTRLYRDGMFHGPTFRGVVSIDRTGDDGTEATLALRPAGSLLGFPGDQSLITDPVLLDQPGQVVGFWTAEHLESGYVIFPFYVRALNLYESGLGTSERARCRARIELVGERQVRSDLEVLSADGRVGVRFEGWEDRRFDLPEPFFRFLLAPREVVLSEPWLAPQLAWPAADGLHAYRSSVDSFGVGFFFAHGSIWARVLAHLILSRRERDLWRSIRTPETRRLEWLMGRMAAKDAVRQHLKQQHALDLCPADIEILPDRHGRPVVAGPWVDQTGIPPVLSISHSNGTAVAIALAGVPGASIGVDVEHAGRMNEAVAQMAFTPGERELLSSMREAEPNNWRLRLWCAKEAVAKALGTGMVGGPQGLIAQGIDRELGSVQVGISAEMARQLPPASATLPHTALTAQEGDLILAVCLHDEGHSSK